MVIGMISYRLPGAEYSCECVEHRLFSLFIFKLHYTAYSANFVDGGVML